MRGRDLGLFSIKNLETLFAARANSFRKDNVTGLAGPRNGLIIAPHFGDNIGLGFPLLYQNLQLPVEGVIEKQFVAVHLDLFNTRFIEAASTGSPHYISKRPPA
jgi:hypothetical protein